MSTIDFHLRRQRAAKILRDMAEPYLRSNKQYDHNQGQVLNNIADDLLSNELEQAAVRFDALHANIKKSLPFEVLDIMDKAEHALSSI